jgi:D-glycero-alpha-D-manno-heptose-7-phosphate kinase
MIITQTPLRISFAGGGTDFADFYRAHGGAVLSSAIDKYIYVIIKARFDRKIRVGYTRTEMVDDVNEIEHELVRECLKLTGISHGVEIATMADIPSEGSGLGSSSTVTVGLLNAMHAYNGDLVTAEQLADEACHIEICELKKPIGKQDQYIAAYGGLRRIVFHQDERTEVVRVATDADIERRLSESLLLFYTGITRKADNILAQQKANIEDQVSNLLSMKAQVAEVEQCLLGHNLNKFGRVLNQGPGLRRRMSTVYTSARWMPGRSAARLPARAAAGFYCSCALPTGRLRSAGYYPVCASFISSSSATAPKLSSTTVASRPNPCPTTPRSPRPSSWTATGSSTATSAAIISALRTNSICYLVQLRPFGCSTIADCP